MNKIDIKSLTKDRLREEIGNLGEKAFRADQMYDWMHKRLVRNFDEMTNISKQFREKCKERFFWAAPEIVRIQESAADGTKKYLFRLYDGEVIESVLMRYKHGNSVCISSQAGCRMGCRFCASTLDGLSRNLTASEMLDQIYAITLESGERVSNAVVMGTGEPLDNYDNLVGFIRILTGEDGLNISQRNVTVSTCGLVPQIYALAEEKFQITLALSLHAATDGQRRELMPIANQYSIEQLMKACEYYFNKTGRRITFEYSMLAGMNDSEADADRLARLAKPLHSHINLIPVNPIKERNFRQPEQKFVRAFKNKLEKYGINVTIRREMGRDIEGACGQLRKRHMEEKGEEEKEC